MLSIRTEQAMNPIPFQTVQHARTRARAPDIAPAVLPAGDTRWVLAARASLAADTHAQTTPQDRERLVLWAGRHGVAPIHAAAIIAIAEQANARGGLDAQAAAQIAALPVPVVVQASDRLGAWLTGVIVLLGGVALVLFVLRWT